MELSIQQLQRVLREQHGLEIIPRKELVRLENASTALQFLSRLDPACVSGALAAWPMSKAQRCQDLFVLAELGFKRGGYFVEVGATDGVELSNTYLLETTFDWQGIVAEPARAWHAALSANRSCDIEYDCVWRASGATLTFNETEVAHLSTIDRFSDGDLHAAARRTGQRYPVQTVSLADMLERHGAPRRIDYLSVDTEGAEWDILSAFDFSQYDVSVITCEHNHTATRDKIHALLSAQGYVRRLEEFSDFDDWYVRRR